MNRFSRLVLQGVLAGLCTIIVLPTPSHSVDKFYCGSFDGVPATMTKASRTGLPVPIIAWRSAYFSDDQWSPQKRCEAVTSRFNILYSSGRLKMLTSGRINGMPVICAATARGAGCASDGLLYTLKPGQNAGETLRKLLLVRVKSVGPLTETSQRLYVSLEELEGRIDSSSGSSNLIKEKNVNIPVEVSPEVRDLW